MPFIAFTFSLNEMNKMIYSISLLGQIHLCGIMPAVFLQPEFQPAKYFSIDRVFRNETLDATHLAEFHQIEGVVADRNLTLGHLMGVLREFFHKLGMVKCVILCRCIILTLDLCTCFLIHSVRCSGDGIHVLAG